MAIFQERPGRQWEAPQRTCREAVFGDYQAYSCELPDLHGGPCRSWSVQASVQRRQAWETANPQDPQERTGS